MACTLVRGPRGRNPFSKRWTDLGGEIWVDLNSRLDPYGPSNFKGDLATQLQAKG